MTDHLLLVQKTSTGFAEWFGFDHDEIIGKPLHQLPSIPTKYQQQVLAKLQAVVENRTALMSKEPALRRVNGQLVPVVVKWVDRPVVVDGSVHIHSIGYPL